MNSLSSTHKVASIVRSREVRDLINRKLAFPSVIEGIFDIIRNSEYSGRVGGGAIGAVGGAIAGAKMSSPGKRLQGGVIGGLIGGNAGYNVGKMTIDGGYSGMVDDFKYQLARQKYGSDSTVLSPREKPKGLRSSDLIDPSIAATIGADYYGVHSFGSARAGRAEAMASAMGQDVPYSVRAPRRHSIGAALAGVLGGGILGAAAGGLVAKDRGSDLDSPSGGASMYGGYMLGSMAGGTVGAVLATIKRRREMRRISSDFDEFDGEITPTARKGHVLGFSPSHARGREEAFRAMLGGDRKMRGSTTENISTFVPFGAGPVLAAPLSPFLVNDSNENMAEIARRDGAYGFQKNMEKFASAPGTRVQKALDAVYLAFRENQAALVLGGAGLAGGAAIGAATAAPGKRLRNAAIGGAAGAGIAGAAGSIIDHGGDNEFRRGRKDFTKATGESWMDAAAVLRRSESDPEVGRYTGGLMKDHVKKVISESFPGWDVQF